MAVSSLDELGEKSQVHSEEGDLRRRDEPARTACGTLPARYEQKVTIIP